RAAADAVVRVGQQVRVGQRRGPRLACGLQVAGGELRVVRGEHAGGLGGRRGQVQRGGGGRRVQLTRLRVQVRQQGQAGPLPVVDLVVGHARQRLAVRHLHAQQELLLPAGLVEHVGDAVAGLRDVERAAGEGRLAPLVQAHERVRRAAAVDDVLAVVAGVVPAAADVQEVVADAGLAGHADVALVRLDADVTGRAAV